MSTTTVWFNHNLANTWQNLRLIRQAQRSGEFRLICSHSDPHYPGRHESDLFFAEPRGLEASAYVAYCLEVVRRLGVDVVWPWRQLTALVQAQADFASLGTRIVAAADAPTLDVLRSKARQYGALGPELVAIPPYRVVNTLAAFDAAYAELRSRGELVCCKPDVSIYGLGFRILADSPGLRQRLQASDPYVTTREEARRDLAAREPFADLLVMPYLEGPERSVDCLAYHGELLRCVVRRKLAPDPQQQWIESNPDLEQAVRRLTAHFQLHAVFNVQFCNHRGVPYLLEINPRMSGGLPAACAAGLVFPYWALRLEAGTVREEDVPQPRTGLQVTTTEANRSF